MAFNKPTTVPRWADTGTRVEPPNAKKDAGWITLEKPPASYFNWLDGVTGDWLKWINERVFDGPQAAATPWAASTAYTVGQIRRNGGNLYSVTIAGTSAASGGPSGTGSSILDGTVTWAFAGFGTDFANDLTIRPIRGLQDGATIPGSLNLEGCDTTTDGEDGGFVFVRGGKGAPGFPGGIVTIVGGAPNAAGGAGGSTFIQGAASIGGNIGGGVSVTGGAATNGAGNVGGSVTIAGGQGTTNGGPITITGGAGFGAGPSNGAGVTMQGGAPGTTGAGGGVTIIGRNSVGAFDGGPLQILAGLGGAGAHGGFVNIFTGDSGAGTDLQGGTLTLRAGASTGSQGSSILLQASVGGASGTTVRAVQQFLHINGDLDEITFSKDLVNNSSGLGAVRKSSSTNTRSTSIRVKHQTTAAMVDGFGAQLDFVVRDDTAVDNIVGRIHTRRHGADTTSQLFIESSAGGSGIVVDRNGFVGVGDYDPAFIAVDLPAELTVRGNLYPFDTDSYDLGDNTHVWRRAYINDIFAPDVIDFRPENDASGAAVTMRGESTRGPIIIDERVSTSLASMGKGEFWVDSITGKLNGFDGLAQHRYIAQIFALTDTSDSMPGNTWPAFFQEGAVDIEAIIPQGTLRAGSQIRIRAAGLVTLDTDAAPGALSFSIGFETAAATYTVVPAVVWNSPVANNTYGWEIDYLISVRTAVGAGSAAYSTAHGSIAIGGTSDVGQYDASQAAITFDSSLAGGIGIKVRVNIISTGDAGDSATMTNFVVDVT